MQRGGEKYEHNKERHGRQKKGPNRTLEVKKNVLDENYTRWN